MVQEISRRSLLRATATIGVLGAGVGIGTASTAHAATGFYNPFTGYPISDGWAEHIARGSLGGIDYAMPVGTRLPAAGGGVVTNTPYNGTGGHTVTIRHDNGYRTQYMHLSQFLLGDGTRVGMGDVVGLSGGAAGAPGSGSSTGPHLHWHMIDPNGARINPLAFLESDIPGVPVVAPVYETGNHNWQPMLVGHNGQALYASTISAVVRADGTKIIYSVRDGRLYEAASNTGWRNLQVPNHDQVSAVSAVAQGDGIVVYTVRGGAVYEAGNHNWQPMLVGHNGQALYATTISAVVRADGTKIIYSVRDGRLHEAASNAGWRNLQVPNHDQVSAVSAVAQGDGIIVYTVRGGAVYEAGNHNWQPMLVGYDGQPLYASTLNTIVRADGTKIIYSVRDGRVYEAASNTGWRNLQVPNLNGVTTVAAIQTGGTVLYTC